MKFHANSATDLHALAVALSALPNWYALAHVHDLGLMKCRQQPLAFTMWVLHKTKGTGGMLHFFRSMDTKSPDTVNDWYMDTVIHINHGSDTEDRDSVGGWSQREIDLLCARLPILTA